MAERMDYISFPIELHACPLFTTKEKIILADIIRLSDKFLDTGGCTKTNKQIAYQHQTGSQTITNLIVKANKLGFVIDRQDKLYSKNNMHKTQRSIQMGIPIEWGVMGDLYNLAYYKGDKEAATLFVEINRQFKAIPIKNITQLKVVRIIHYKIKGYNKKVRGGNLKFIGGVTENLLAIYKGLYINKGLILNTSKEVFLAEDGNDIFDSEGKNLPVSFDKIFSSWNKISSESKNICSLKKLTEARKAKIRTRNKNMMLSAEDWQSAFEEISKSKFLDGENNRGWSITFDWLINSDVNFTKVLEGNFQNTEKKSNHKNRTGAAIGKYDNISKTYYIDGKKATKEEADEYKKKAEMQNVRKKS